MVLSSTEELILFIHNSGPLHTCLYFVIKAEKRAFFFFDSNYTKASNLSYIVQLKKQKQKRNKKNEIENRKTKRFFWMYLIGTGKPTSTKLLDFSKSWCSCFFMTVQPNIEISCPKNSLGKRQIMKFSVTTIVIHYGLLKR